MEGGAVTLELTFREAPTELGTSKARSGSRSPKPRTGWYRPRRSSLGGGSRGRSPSSPTEAEGWASTDADRQALRWHAVGNAEIPEFDTCALLPWIAEGLANGEGDIEALRVGGERGEGVGDGPWTELGVYPPRDERKRRQAVLMGFRAAVEPVSKSRDSAGYAIALLVETGAQRGVAVTELCRAPLQAGQEPVTINRDKMPPGAPTGGRAAVEAVCADGWVRRWCLACSPTSEAERNATVADCSRDKKRSCFTLRAVNLCHPFLGSGRGRQSNTEPGIAKTVTPPNVALIAVASPSLLAVARTAAPPQGTGVTVDATAAVPPKASPFLEVWSCSATPYPRSKFRKEGRVALRGLRDSRVVEGMCWVSPEAGDERGAAVSGHCLCVSLRGTVTVLARERRERTTARPGLLTAVSRGDSAGDRSEWGWSPVFRVANPCSLLSSRTAGLRDFCQVSKVDGGG